MVNIIEPIESILSQFERKKTRIISWEFFLQYTNQSEVYNKIKDYIEKRRIHGRRDRLRAKWNNREISQNFSRWKEKKFLIMEFDLTKRKSGVYYPSRKYIFNLNPLFLYLLEKNITLNDKEKNLLEWIFLPTPTRSFIYHRFKKTDDIITAMLKFYVGVLYINYANHKNSLITTLRKDLLDKEFFDQIIEKQRDEEINYNRKYDEKEEIIKVKKKQTKEEVLLEKNFKLLHDYLESYDLQTLKLNRKTTTIKINDEDKFKETLFDIYLPNYTSLHKYFPELMKELDKKMLQALGINFEY